MKRQRIALIVILSAMTFVVSLTLAGQERYTLKSPNAIAFSEFKG